MILALPWTIVSLIAYNIFAFFFTVGEDASVLQTFQKVLFTIPMISGGSWTVNLGDLVLFLAFVALFVEILKATRTSTVALVDHGLSILIFIICLIEFLLVDRAATSLFFFITLTALIDVIAGFSIGMRAARRDLSVGGDLH